MGLTAPGSPLRIIDRAPEPPGHPHTNASVPTIAKALKAKNPDRAAARSDQHAVTLVNLPHEPGEAVIDVAVSPTAQPNISDAGMPADHFESIKVLNVRRTA